MTDNFELVQSGIRVREAGSHRINRVDTPQGFTDLMFRNVVAAFDTAYRTHGALPDVNEVHKFYPQAPVKTIAKLFTTDEFRQAVAYRGISWEVDSGLSIEQNMALLKMNDPFDKRSQAVKLKEIGVPYARWSAWLRDPLFALVYRKQAENNLQDAIPLAENALIGNVDSGDLSSIKLLFEMTGRWNPAQMQLDDAKTVVLAVVESVLKHVQDPEIRRAILDDVRANVVSFELTHQPAIEG